MILATNAPTKMIATAHCTHVHLFRREVVRGRWSVSEVLPVSRFRGSSPPVSRSCSVWRLV